MSDSELELDPTQCLTLKDFDIIHEELYYARCKWFNLGLALGVNIIELQDISDRYHEDNKKCFCAMLEYCLKNISFTWCDICKALKKNTVEHKNLASKIEKRFIRNHTRSKKRSDGGSTCTEESEESDEKDAESSTVRKRKSCGQSKKCLIPQKRRKPIKRERKQGNPLDVIQSEYTELKETTIESLSKNGTRGHDIGKFLNGYVPGRFCKRSEGSIYLLQDLDSSWLSQPKSIDDTFHSINPLLSFFNYQVLKEIVSEFGKCSDQENVKLYTEEFEEFLQKWKVQSLEISNSTNRQMVLKMKLDTDSLNCYVPLKRNLANILTLRVADIFLLKIELNHNNIGLFLALPWTVVRHNNMKSLADKQISAIAEWKPTVLSITSGDIVLYEKTIIPEVELDPTVKMTPSKLLLKECRSKTPDIEKVRSYLENNKDVINVRDEDEFQWSPLMWACENKHFEIARLLLKYRPHVNIQDKKEWSPLILASRAGDLEIVQGIVELGAEIDKPTNKKQTPLMWAAREGHVNVARFLMEKGAIVDFKDIRGWTPLMEASQQGHVNIVNLLLDPPDYRIQPANVNHTTPTLWCALMAAAKNKRSEVVEALLKGGAEVDIEREDGTTTLQVASFFDNNSAVISTLIKHKANVDHMDKNGMTALMLAAAKVSDCNSTDDSGRLNIVQALLDSESIDIHKRHSGTGWTALFFAAHAGYPTVFKALLSQGAATEIGTDKVEDIARISGHELILTELKAFKELEQKAEHEDLKKQLAAEKEENKRTKEKIEYLEEENKRMNDRLKKKTQEDHEHKNKKDDEPQRQIIVIEDQLTSNKGIPSCDAFAYYNPRDETYCQFTYINGVIILD